jgi:hypothetical protein
VTRFAWVFNLDADFELTHPSYNTTDRMREALAKHGTASRALMGPDDVVAAAGLADAAQYVGRCWCPTPKALAQLHRAGVTPEAHPPLAVLRRVNHRRFAHELGGGLPDQRYVDTPEAFAALRTHQEPSWMIKRPLAFAGRGQLRVTGPLDAKQNNWIAASLRRDGLIVEPLVRPTVEVSLHGFIRRDGHRELGQVCLQEVSARGVFRQASVAPPSLLADTERRALLAQAERVAQALSAAGYFGPFGIDAYRYASDRGDGFCTLSEINARYTLGFAIGFSQPAHTLLL